MRCDIITSAIFILHLVAGGYGKPSDTCNRQRMVLTEPMGVITDGNDSYRNDSHCEWLIKAPPGETITLSFRDMDTECSYDHVFVYDGASYENSTLLGCFSGKFQPPVVTAMSGAMLLLLYSDTNYVRKGFVAEYWISRCPRNCSMHGECDTTSGKCQCETGWTGNACQYQTCPENCNAPHKMGNCSADRCNCNAGFSGQACSLPLNPRDSSVGWHLLSENDRFSPRAGHDAVYVPFTDQLYSFGGRNFSHVMDDFLVYNFNTSTWLTLEIDKGPSARWGHSMVLYTNTIVLFGGITHKGVPSAELWSFNIARREWFYHEPNGTVEAPAVSSHASTLVDGKWLYVLGGRLANGAFSNTMYRVNLNTIRWEKVVPLGGSDRALRLVGHTATFHADSRTIFVYGGVTVDFARFSKLSWSLLAYHVDQRHWTRLSGPVWTPNQPLERAFHTVAIVANYLVLFGGYMHKHNEEEQCFDHRIYLYHLKCHKWISFERIASELVAVDRAQSHNGVYAHAMAVRRGHTILVLGGYSGYMRGDLWAYHIPVTVTHAYSESASEACVRHRDENSCRENPACGWCQTLRLCIDRAKKQDCGQGAFVWTQCPGLCPALRDCQSCMLWGEGVDTNHVGSGGFMPRTCGWCVSSSQCHSLNDPPIVCRSPRNQTTPQVEGYWGPQGHVVTVLNECRSHDYRPGLTFLHYKSPVNLSQPDEVSYVNESYKQITLMSDVPGEPIGEGVGRFLGYLHPMGIQPVAQDTLKLYMDGTASGLLWLGTDETLDSREQVANHTSSRNRTEAHRKSGNALFPIVARGYRYILDDMAFLKCDGHRRCERSLELKWNAFPHIQRIPMKYLEPYRNGTCYIHTTCLSCLSDAACGWCGNPHNQCVSRQRTDGPCSATRDTTGGGAAPTPNAEGGVPRLALEVDQCSACSYYIYCGECSGDAHCEWIVEEAQCVRRGRFEGAIRQTHLCPTPCHLRDNCSSCLGDPGRCAWCEQTQQCFLFSTYTTSFMFGGCREWVDEDHRSGSLILTSSSSSSAVLRSPNFSSQCPNCSVYQDCASCLQKLGCGWCGNDINPNNGTCFSGDFTGPRSLANCSVIVASRFSGRHVTEPASWSYDSCPNVDECRLGLATCHLNATCVDTRDGYYCRCNKGFKGDGNSTCIKTCAEECVHGICSEAPDYRCDCDLGWTGRYCETNCGCNNHSDCPRGVGRCEQCHNMTEGGRCERCVAGSYGNATTPYGCRPCECNGHGNSTLGTCDAVTGRCHCIHYTTGSHCEQCVDGYYGDPRHGGTCFVKCHNKKTIVISGDNSIGALGSYSAVEDTGVNRYCLWMLQVPPGTKHLIELTVLPGLNVRCPENFVFVYDGLPPFVSLSLKSSRLLGAFCGVNSSRSHVVVANTGQLSIYYERNNLENQGFNATYRLLPCVSCNETECLSESKCDADFVPAVSRVDCPNNCSSHLGQGNCDHDYKLCKCQKSFVGADCSIMSNESQVAWSLLYEMSRVAINRPDTPNVQFGHTLLSIEPNQLWLFGGVSEMNVDSNRLYLYDINFDQWKLVNTSQEAHNVPAPRRFHGAVMLGTDMYVFGGLNALGVLGDLWKFATDLYTWTRVPTTPDVPALVGLTLTNIQGRLCLVGGFSPDNGFLDKTLVYTPQTMEWKVLNTTGSSPVGLYGHSSVYHQRSETLYVFGGIIYDVDHTLVSENLYALHIPSQRWTRVPPDERVTPVFLRVAPRYMHSGVLLEDSDQMLIVGGRNSSSVAILKPLLYHFDCNRWIQMEEHFVDSVGVLPESLSAVSTAVLQNTLYIYGGSSETLSGALYRVKLPSNGCTLLRRRNGLDCVQTQGCSYCAVKEESRVLTKHCYGVETPTPSACLRHEQTGEFQAGKVCNSTWIRSRSCYQYTSCEDCLSHWPVHNETTPSCKWCEDCRVGRCMSSFDPCPEPASDCILPKSQQRPITASEHCPLRKCVASECEKCRDLGHCIWTRQVLRTSSILYQLNIKPVFDWTCVPKEIKDQSSFPVESCPPRSCPPRCAHYTNCSACLSSHGGEGGWHECWWTRELGQCITPSFAPLRCEGGSCGTILRGSATEMCSPPCHFHTQASTCLEDPRCGWCGLISPQANGQGLCMEGGKDKPTGGTCKNGTVFLNGHPLPGNVSHWLNEFGNTVEWFYFVRPVENECLNGHHTCDEERQECIDTQDGFLCQCRNGYVFSNATSICQPVCSLGCVHGSCVRPDTCSCNFGYVGVNCSTPCECNGHSDCAGPDQLNVCLQCHNHTTGATCDVCEPYYVGSPVNGGRCESCLDYCNRHTNTCVDPTRFPDLTPDLHRVEAARLAQILEESSQMPGPLKSALCISCQNHTTGTRCGECQEGFFIVRGHIRNGCRPCECHGHGDTCNKVTGEDCNCRNNTENDRGCETKSSRTSTLPCWHLQCSKCKDNYQGVPTNGHQCYRHMRLEQDYCLDPENQDCSHSSSPSALPLGRTLFFVVQPRYMNVDIRIIVDVTEGGLDVHLAAKDDVFVIDVNSSSWTHNVLIDRKYTIVDPSSSTQLPQLPTVSTRRPVSQSRRDIINTVVGEPLKKMAISSGGEHSVMTTPLSLRVRPHHARHDEYITFVRARDPTEILAIHNVFHRLIITIPQEVYDLKSSRIYMVLRGEGDVRVSATHGNLFFRQDQTRIDLFVFFSVFFSCFFLFLALCGIVWKMKQALDVRRARRLHAAEMQHMANRPFGRIVADVGHIATDIGETGFYEPWLLREYDAMNPLPLPQATAPPLPPSPFPWKRRANRQIHQASDGTKMASKGAFCSASQPVGVRPLASEFTADQQAAVATVLVQLPGDYHAPVRLCLGSALALVRGLHSTFSTAGIRAAINRRRPVAA